MSRSFRCRHLPTVRGSRFPVSALRISDGARVSTRQDVYAEARLKVEELYGPRPEPAVRLVRVKGLAHTVYHHAQYRRDAAVGFITTKPAWSEKLPGRIMTTQEAWEWDQAVEREINTTVSPIASWHPLQRHPPQGKSKKSERVQANRGMRRRTREILRSETINEDWRGHFPARAEYFDWWSIY